MTGHAVYVPNFRIKNEYVKAWCNFVSRGFGETFLMGIDEDVINTSVARALTHKSKADLNT
jgi:hypothetical protein